MVKHSKIQRSLNVAGWMLSNIIHDLRICKFYIQKAQPLQLNLPCSMRFLTVECIRPHFTIYHYASNLFSSFDYPLCVLEQFDKDYQKYLKRYEKLRGQYLRLRSQNITDESIAMAIRGITVYIRYSQCLRRSIKTYKPSQILVRGRQLKKYLKVTRFYGNRLQALKLLQLAGNL